MRYRLALAAVVLQVFVLAYMAGEREWVLHYGRPVRLRTAPIDPNDPMRGDYARLDYEIAQVPRDLCRGGLTKLFVQGLPSRPSKDIPVYAVLRLGADGVAELVELTDTKPAGGLFIRGRTQAAMGNHLQVRYGIEAFFMQQGAARKLEDMRRKDRPGVPLDMEIALGSSGLAVLKSYEWEPLGITITFERGPAPAQPATAPAWQRQQGALTGLSVELKNYGPEDVAIVALPDGGSFRLVPDRRGQEIRYRWVGENQTAPPPEPGHVIVLKPGQSHVTKLDLTQPQWFVTDIKAAPDKQKPMTLREVTETWSASFRVEYAPPEKTTALPHADLIRPSRLRSRVFNANQGVD